MPAAASTGTRRLPAPKVQPSGRWGLWLAAQRTAAKRTQKQVFDDLRTRWPDLFPWRSETSLDSYRAFEKGLATPDEAQQAAFLEYYPEAAPPAVDLAAGAEANVPAAVKPYLDELRAYATLVERLIAQNAALMAANGIRLPVVETDEARIARLADEAAKVDAAAMSPKPSRQRKRPSPSRPAVAVPASGGLREPLA